MWDWNATVAIFRKDSMSETENVTAKVVFFFSARDGNQDLSQARQALYH
jgi:hypothetical protein